MNEEENENLEGKLEKLQEQLSDEEIDGLLGLVEFMEAFDDPEEKLTNIVGNDSNYCPNCGEEL